MGIGRKQLLLDDTAPGDIAGVPWLDLGPELAAHSGQGTVARDQPIAGCTSTPARRITANSSLERPRPAPRPERSPADFSNTATSQPILRNRQAANSPPTEPPITSARGTICVSASCGGRPLAHSL